MKKYVVSILVAAVLLIGTPFMAPRAMAADINIRDFVNLLVLIGVITPDKMPAVNAFLATLDHTSTTTPITPGPIKVHSPNGGEIYKVGDTISLRWSPGSSARSSAVSISLVDTDPNKACGGISFEGCQNSFFIATTTNNGRYDWDTNKKMFGASTGPNSVSVYPGSDFRIAISVNSNSGIVNTNMSDQSDSNFKIVAASTDISSITVISPNGGEDWQKDTMHTIRWRDTNRYITTPYYSIYLDKECTSEICLPINLAIRVSGSSYEWKVDKQLTIDNAKYKIRVCDVAESQCDSSNGYFTVTPVNTSDDGVNYPKLDLFTPEVDGYTVVQNGVTFPLWESSALTGVNLDTTWCKTENPKAVGDGPFEFSWGDGAKSCSWFPAEHQYSSLKCLNPTFSKCLGASDYKIEVRVKNSIGRIASRDIHASVPSAGYITPINGVCGNAYNSCTVGNYVDIADTNTHILWKCNGVNGGTTASCSSPITVVETCTPNWQCSNWNASSCEDVQRSISRLQSHLDLLSPSSREWATLQSQISSLYSQRTSMKQTRSCTDSNSCGVLTGKPIIVESCLATVSTADASQNYATASIGWESILKLLQALR